MSVDEAIKHAKDSANTNYEMASAYHDDFGVYKEEESRYREYAEKHEQLAEWLEELKVLREKAKGNKWYQQGRADKEAEIKPLLNAIKFTLEDYSTRLGDYAKVIDEKLKE